MAIGNYCICSSERGIVDMQIRILKVIRWTSAANRCRSNAACNG